MNLKKIFAGVGVTVLSAAFFVTQSASAVDSTVVVTPGNMQGWGFIQETPTGSGALETGPSVPPSGTGSANLIVDSTGGEALAKAVYQGTRLDDITNLEYNTYRESGGPALAIALQFGIDSDSTDASTAFQGRLVYEPYHTQTVLDDIWQVWDPMNDSAGTGTGNWWFSNGALALASGCSQATPCTWAEVLVAYPNAGINATSGAVFLKAGGGWTGGFDGNVDALTIGVNGDNTTFDFEFVEPTPTPTPTPTVTPTPTPTVTPTPTPTPIVVGPPTDKDQCKNGGWMTFNNPSFKNQGQCVSYTNHN